MHMIFMLGNFDLFVLSVIYVYVCTSPMHHLQKHEIQCMSKDIAIQNERNGDTVSQAFRHNLLHKCFWQYS